MTNEVLDFTAKKIDIIAEKGTRVDFVITYADPSAVPISLTGFSVRLQVRSRFGLDQSAILDLQSSSIAGSRIIKNDALGEIRIIIDEDDTLSIDKGDYQYDLVLYKTDDVRRLLAGKFILKEAVTVVS